MGKRFLISLLICLFFLAGCPAKAPDTPPQTSERPLFERISAAEMPALNEDVPADALRAAVQKSLAWYSRVPDDKPISFGKQTASAKAFRESLSHFLSLLDAGKLDAENISREFDIFRVIPQDRSGKMLITGYYEPVLEGSLKEGGQFKWPLYGIPSDLVVIELDRFDPAKFHGERLIGRVEKNRVVPYYSRSEIDGQKVLERSGVLSGGPLATPLAWLKDPVDSFFLHIQGSGVIRLPDGRQARVGYAGANGRPYHSIGKTLIESGAISREEMSFQAIRRYLHSNPEKQNEIMWKNESYVFYKWVSEGPLGSLGAVVTEGRSVASDPKFHPRGAICFLISEKPRYDEAGQLVAWDRLSRWVLNQDAGGAIKGPGRMDLFCGTGELAEKTAGPMKQPGELYYFIKKGLIAEEG
ncbi:MAG: murein transglycosylase A [Syntrophobacteraceae bacterium]